MKQLHSIHTLDILVSIFCLLILCCCLGAIGRSGRGRAKEIVCQANLLQWGIIFQDYANENEGRLFSGTNRQGYWWPWQLDDELKDWKTNKIWFCPTTGKQFFYDELGNVTGGTGIFSSWGIFTGDQGEYSDGPSGINGSYGLNGFLLNISFSQYEGGVPATEGWSQYTTITEPSRVPTMLDAMRFDLWPLETNGPAAFEEAAWSANNMARCCINRHAGFVCSGFADGSARKVGLKELWTLKWHKSFNTSGPWTQAGGVLPADWPEWMREFKEY